MSYSAIVAALKTAFEAVTDVKFVLDYEPKAIHDTPMMYLLLDTVGRDRGPDGVVNTNYRVLATLVLRWQDNEATEQNLIDMLDDVLGALDDDITLGGMDGYALIVDADAGYQTISGTLYRIVEFGIEAVETACV